MRCIEIVEGTIGEDCVLMININMRCIEMIPADVVMNNSIKININMRCIEIEFFAIYIIAQLWLTLTWDVLKL